MKIKKVLICLMSVLILMVSFGIISAWATSPASAGDLVISVESVTAPAGDTVIVTLSVTSNPGFSYLRLTVTQDDTLTLIDAENGSILKDFDQGVNLMWSADTQSTATGTLVTLTFKVADNAVQGYYPITIKFRECYNDNYDDVPATIISGSVTVACSHKNTIVTEEIAATCTTTGRTEGKYCADCGEVLIAQESIPAMGHTEVIDAVVSATCTESGLSEGKHCAVCKEVLMAQEVIPALGHDYLETRVVRPTCTEIGYTVYTCENCGKSKNENTVPATGHTFLNYTYNNNATCTQNGTESAQCEHCDAKDSRIKEGTMLDHEYEWKHNSQSHYQVCVNCSFETEHGLHRSDSPATEENAEICLDCGRVLTPTLQHVHSMTLIEEKLPTCTKKGNVEHYFCHKCGKLFEDLYGFSSVELQDVEIPATGHKYKSVVTEPTCLNQGYTTNTCELCSRIEELDYVQALGHDYKEMIVAPTCMEDGYTLHECARCDDSYTDHKVDALGHKPGADADCLNDQSCTVCGEILVGMLGHDYNAVVTAPTCTEKGYTTHTCSRCDDTYTDSEVAELGHKPGTEADCLNDQTCTVCDEVLVGKLGHDYNAVVTAPTCTEKGYTTHTCSRCGDTYTDSEVAELGHKPGTEADCFNDQTCTVCGVVLTDKLGHDYNAVVIAPTCTEKGYTTHTCSRCNDTYVDSEVAELGHKPGAEADCLNDQTCTVCGEVLKGKLGHDYNAVVTDPACTEKGYTTHTCSRCDDTYVDSEVAELGHKPGEWIVDQEPAPGIEGSKHIECTVCGETLETAVIEALPVETEPETETSLETEDPTESDSKQEDPRVSNGCFGLVSADIFCLIILISVASLIFVKRREKNS